MMASTTVVVWVAFCVTNVTWMTSAVIAVTECNGRSIQSRSVYATLN